MTQNLSQTLQKMIEDLNKNYTESRAVAELELRLQESPKTVTIFGGTNYLGKSLSKMLTCLGFRVKSVWRRGEQNYSINQIGNFDQIQLLQLNPNKIENILEILDKSDYVIYTDSGKDKKGASSFENINYKLPLQIASLAQERNIPFIFFSTTQHQDDSLSLKAKYCAMTEDKITQHHQYPIILRPSFIFGAEDKLFNSFANLARFTKHILLFGKRDVYMQPIAINDITNFVKWLFLSKYIDNIHIPSWFDLGGSEKLTKDEILEQIAHIIDRPIKPIYLPLSLGMFLGSIFNILRKIPLFSCLPAKEQIIQLSLNSTVSKGSQQHGFTLDAARIKAQLFSSVAPSYMWVYRKQGQFTSNQTPDWSR